ncbi:MAG: preprotein translocase subunit SecA, partial [Sphingomonadales bacterium]
GSANDRIVRQHLKTVETINELEDQFLGLTDEELRAKTDEYRTRIKDGETLDQLLPEAFATVREAAKRTLGQRHFDVQMVGGIVLHNGEIAEMRTGEGKTLVATLAAYLNALSGQGVHVITVNDYLAVRDAGWMGQVYEFLGLTVGVIINSKSDNERKEAYNSDITYGTNNEFGFDYLRDNMKFALEDMAQRPFNFAIVDEVDSILIDEARTPLIISGPTEDKTDLYVSVDKVIQKLSEEDYDKEEKNKSITLTEDGTEKIERLLEKASLLQSSNLYDYENTNIVHHMNQALKARVMFERDRDYIVKENKVVIIDEFTGRMMDGRRYSDGLHQAIEAKEKVTIQSENQTLASITFQNYFRMYTKLSGMTGTALTEAQEFADIYSLAVVDMPTNVDVKRIDEHDEFYRTQDEKYEALVEEMIDCQKRGQPVLVGTVSIEKSEGLSSLFKKNKIKHNVLNARYHEQEAYIISQAGRAGAITIATNMAGRGTDIQLGGNLEMRVEAETVNISDKKKHQAKVEEITKDIEENKTKVLEAGGLYVVGTERHESRRIDNQLRGRSGRQGDPGKSKFYLSLQDDLMRIFGPERMDSMLVKLGLEEGEAIIHPWINKAIEKAQGKVEARNYDIRKNLLKYDNVQNDQRKVIYEQRKDIMQADDVSETTKDMRNEVIEDLVISHIPPKSFPDQWDVKSLSIEVREVFNTSPPILEWANEEGVEENILVERISDTVSKYMEAKEKRYTPELWKKIEKSLLLQIVDQDWKEHLSSLEHLRSVIHFRAYAQRDPLNEYKTEGFGMFEDLLVNIRKNISQLLSHVEINVEQAPMALAPKEQEMIERHIDPTTGEDGASSPAPLIAPMARNIPPEERNPTMPGSWGKVSRNEPCPCGSGKKYKHCHGGLYSNVGRNDLCPCGSGKKFKQCHGTI